MKRLHLPSRSLIALAVLLYAIGLFRFAPPDMRGLLFAFLALASIAAALFVRVKFDW